MKKQGLSRREFLKSVGLTSVGLLAAACTGVPVATAPQANTAAQQQTSSEVPPAETVSILMWYQAENHEPEYSGRKAEFEEKFNVSLSYELLGRDAMNKKFPTTLMAGSGFPDIIEQNAGDIVGFMKGEDAEIPLVALNEVLDNSPYFDQVLESRWARYTKDGKIYGTPHDVHPIVLLYNDEAWQTHGVDLSTVETWDDYLAACETVGPDATLSDGREQFPIMDGLNASVLPTLMLQNGVWWTDEEGEPMLTNPGFKAAIENWMRFKDYRLEIDWSNHTALLKSGQAMSQLVPDWFYGIHKQGTADDSEFMANSPMRIHLVPDGSATGSWGGTAASVVKQSDHIPLATEMLLYIYFENGQNQLDTRWLETGILPPVRGAWESEAYRKEDAFVGNQVSGQVFIEAANSLPPYFENWKTNLVSAAWGEQFPLAWEGEISLDEAIAIADENARANIEQNT